LLLLTGGVITHAREREHAPAPSAPTPSSDPIYLEEKKLFAALDDAAERDPGSWIVDSGASNHMTGCRTAFSDIDTGITGNVRLGDGSVVRIEGRGTVLFSCKNGEHRTLANTYLIPRLAANIISVGQLDETGFKVEAEDGVMRIWDEQRRLLARILDVSTSSTSSSRARSALRHASATKHGSGMQGSATLTSVRCGKWAESS
jgi:hypothetical protein